MSRGYRLSRIAEADLDSIWEYIARDNPVAANRVFDSIAERFEMLVRQPSIGEPREEIRSDLRSFPVGKYVIFYSIENDLVTIVRVVHGARDIDNIF